MLIASLLQQQFIVCTIVFYVEGAGITANAFKAFSVNVINKWIFLPPICRNDMFFNDLLSLFIFQRRGKKALETENTYHGSLLPKVPQSKIISHNISNYPVTTFPSSTNFPKIHNGPSMLPSIANTHYNKHHAGMKKVSNLSSVWSLVKYEMRWLQLARII